MSSSHSSRSAGLRAWVLAAGFLLAGGLSACSPTVQLAAPTEPIHIKLDVKIEHEIRIKVEQQLDELLSPKSGLF